MRVKTKLRNDHGVESAKIERQTHLHVCFKYLCSYPTGKRPAVKLVCAIRTLSLEHVMSK